MNAGYLRMAVALWIVALVAGGFAESYPNRLTAGEMNEYVAQGIICGNAVRERELAVNRSQNFLPYCGTWQPYIASLQQELETLAFIYIDHENGPLTDTGDEFLYFTLDNWRAAAGLNANGFRRSTDGISFSYGKMQAGDIIGPWIFEDLQHGFGALKWLPFFSRIVSVRTIFPSVTGKASYSGAGSGSNFGVWYSYGGTLLGGSGTYSIDFDNRLYGGSGSAFYVSVGQGNGGNWGYSDAGFLGLDSDVESPAEERYFSGSLTFLDSVDLVEIVAFRLNSADGGSSGVSTTWTQSSITGSVTFNTGGGPGASWHFFPVVKPPFTNM